MRQHPQHTTSISTAIRFAIAGAALTTAGIASAQETAREEALEEIVVTGFRESLEQSLNIKRGSTGAVDAILAEDIADFPDLNLAESIQRIPGVTIDRVGGEGRQITVRGLSPEFTRVRINGMEALTTTSATDATGTNRGRGFDFNVFASELFNRIAVRKTASAEIDEGSLGATVELQTARPFDYDGMRFVTSYQQGYSDLSENFDPRVAALFSTTNESKTLGVLISAAYTERSILEEGVQSGGWESNSPGAGQWESCPGCANQSEVDLVENAVHARFPRYVHFEHEQERLGLTGSLQWQPADSTLITFDALYSNLDATRTEPFLEAISFARGNAAGRGSTDVMDFEVDANNTLTYGVFNDVDVRSENRYDEWETDFTQFSLSLGHEFSDRFRIDALAGTSKSKLDIPIQTTIILENFDSDNYVYDFRQNSKAPLITYGFDVTDPSSWVVSELRDRPSVQENTFDTLRLDSAFELSETLTLKAGVSWKEYEFDVSEQRRDRSLPIDDDSCSLPLTPVTADQGHLTSFGDDLNVPAGTQTSFFVADINAVADMLGFYTNQSCFPLVTRVQDTRGVIEEDTGAHVQLDFETQLFGLPFRGDIGLRYVETDLSTRGVQAVGDEQFTVTVDHKYDDTLPAVNLVLEPADSFLIRASYSEVMSRPNLGNLTPGGTINGFAVPPTVTFGNPFLEPFRADAYDVSFEWYFAEEALLALALFSKDIESFTSTRTDTGIPWSQIGLPDSLLDQVPASPSDSFDVRRTVNGAGGDLEGFEIQYQQPLTFLPGPEWVSNFGVLVNYTNVDSEVNFAAADEDPLIRDLNGLSEESINFTFYYDDGRLSARISSSYRDQFQRDPRSRQGNDFNFTDEATYVDFSANYNLNDHLKFTLEAINLTDEFRTDLMDSMGRRIENYFHTGTQYYVGLQYSY
jgi:TonB-dependent receptor